MAPSLYCVQFCFVHSLVFTCHYGHSYDLAGPFLQDSFFAQGRWANFRMFVLVWLLEVWVATGPFLL